MHKKFMVLLVCICMLLATLPMALAAVNLNPWEIDYNSGLSDMEARRSNTLLQASDGTVYSGSMRGVWGYAEGKWFDFSQGFPIGFPINDVDISVHALIEPVEGTLYAGTSKGVWKHSGGSWEDVSNGLLGELEVFALLHAADGTLYAGTESGVWKLDGGQWIAFSQGMPEDESFAKVYAMLDATDGYVYAGSSEGIWKLQDGTWISFNEWFDVDENEVPEVLFLFQASDGTQYAGTNAGVWKLVGDVWLHYSEGLAPDNLPWVAALIETTGGTIYAGTMEDVWLLKDETWVSMPTKIDGPLLEVYALLESTSGTLFAASEDGVWSYDADEELWTDISQPVEYADTDVITFLQSSNGTLYAGTGGGVWEKVGNSWVKSMTTSKDSDWLLSSSVDFLVEASDGVIYAVTLRGDAWKWDHGIWTQILDCEMEDFSEDSVSSVVVNGDTLYVGFYWHGVRAYHAGTWVDASAGLPTLMDGSDYLAVNSLVATPEGTMYALASEHIWVYAEGVWTSNPNHPEMEVLSLAMAPDGTLYVAFFPEGIWAYAQGAWTNISAGLPLFNFEGLMACYALPRLVAQDGTLYAQVVTSLDSSGLYAYRGGVWINVSEGLPDDYPAQILGLYESSEATIYAYSIRQGIWGFDGSVWQDVSEGLPYGSGLTPLSVNESEEDDHNYVPVQAMVEAFDGTMYAGTFGEGIWKNRSLSLTSSYTISFDANGGSVTPSSAKTSGNGMLASLPTPTRSGYTFNGWFTVSSGGTRISTSTVFSANGTIYAQWTSSSSYIPPSNNSSSSSSSSSSTSSPASGNTSGWSNLATEAGKTEEGGTFTIDMQGNTNVPSSFLRGIAGQDVDVHFDMGNGLVWVINGKDIPTEGPLSSLNLGARLGGTSLAALVRNIDGSSSYVHLTLTHDGEFPFKVTLLVTLDKVNAGYVANLYYHNPETGKLEFVASAVVNEDGSVQLAFEHASSYAIIVSEASHDLSAVQEDAKPEDETKPEEEETPPVEDEKPSEEENTPEAKPLPIVLTIDSTVVTKGVERLASPPVASKIINGRSMLPFRYLIQTLLGGTVEWVEETRTVHAVVNGITFQLTIDDATIMIDGEAVQLDQAPVIVDDYTLVPLRAFEAAVESIHWLADARQVEVYTAE